MREFHKWLYAEAWEIIALPLFLVVASVALALWRFAPDGQDSPERQPANHWSVETRSGCRSVLLVFTPTLSGKKFRKQQSVLLDQLAWLDAHDVDFFYVPSVTPDYLPNHALQGPDCQRLREWFGISVGQFLVVIASPRGDTYLTSDRPLLERELQALLQAACETYATERED